MARIFGETWLGERYERGKVNKLVVGKKEINEITLLLERWKEIYMRVYILNTKFDVPGVAMTSDSDGS